MRYGKGTQYIDWTEAKDTYLCQSDGVITIENQAKHLKVSCGAVLKRRKRLALSKSLIHGKSLKPEYSTLYFHLRYIHLGITGYKDMPFFPAWNPYMGGSFLEGYKWIIESLGHRPSKGHELHVMNREIGVWPGNLCWLTRSNHWKHEERQQMMERIKQLEDEVSALRQQLAAVNKTRAA